jgi:hypothetical protein
MRLLHWHELISQVIGAHGRHTFYYFGAVGFGKVDAGESASDVGGGVGFFDLIYDESVARFGGGRARISLHDARRV